MNLKNKIAIVTGSTRGIGLAIASSLASEGAHVMISSRYQKDVDRVVESLSSAPGRVVGKTCDVGVASQVDELVGSCVDLLGGLDILVNNAAVGTFKTVETLSCEEWRTTMATNLDSVFYACHAAIPHLKSRGGGFIVNISSLAGKNAFPGGSAYNASKFALTGFSEALMQEVRHDGIRVAYVMPGSVDTWFGGKEPEGETSWKLSAQDVADVVLETLRRHPRCLTSRIEMRPSRPPRQ